MIKTIQTMTIRESVYTAKGIIWTIVLVWLTAAFIAGLIIAFQGHDPGLAIISCVLEIVCVFAYPSLVGAWVKYDSYTSYWDPAEKRVRSVYTRSGVLTEHYKNHRNNIIKQRDSV